MAKGYDMIGSGLLVSLPTAAMNHRPIGTASPQPSTPISTITPISSSPPADRTQTAPKPTTAPWPNPPQRTIQARIRHLCGVAIIWSHSLRPTPAITTGYGYTTVVTEQCQPRHKVAAELRWAIRKTQRLYFGRDVDCYHKREMAKLAKEGLPARKAGRWLATASRNRGGDGKHRGRNSRAPIGHAPHENSYAYDGVSKSYGLTRRSQRSRRGPNPWWRRQAPLSLIFPFTGASGEIGFRRGKNWLLNGNRKPRPRGLHRVCCADSRCGDFGTEESLPSVRHATSGSPEEESTARTGPLVRLTRAQQ
jgi:hypothetical protein